MQLDSRTITLVGMAACMLFSMLGVLVGKGRRTCPGFHHWTIASVCVSLALLFFGLRGMIPDSVSILVGNFMAIASACLVIEGIRRFRGFSNWAWPAPAAGLVALAVLAYFRFQSDDLNARIVFLSVYLGVFSFLAAKHFFAAVGPGFRLSMGFTASTLLLFALGHLSRMFYILSHPSLPSLYAPSAVNGLLILGAVLGIIAWSFGFFLINHDYMVQGLKKAEARALRADAAKSDFLANVSHEIRTPMNGVIGLAELLLETPLDLTQRDYVETVRESSMALLVIVNELLDLSKIEAGKIELVAGAMDPREVVEKTVQLLSWKAENKGLKLIWEVAPDVPRRVLGDAGRLRQVLTNLAANALKFTRQGEIAIRVRIEDGKLRFSVTDTGPGISQQEQAQLFERFEQLKDARQNGTGLGLAISKELAQLMGGQIGVTSEVGIGSTFWFTAACPKLSTFDEEPVYAPPAESCILSS
jgi:signal transduction histidine kinase